MIHKCNVGTAKWTTAKTAVLSLEHCIPSTIVQITIISIAQKLITTACQQIFMQYFTRNQIWPQIEHTSQSKHADVTYVSWLINHCQICA